MCIDYNLEKLLKQLSLEKYWPIFEKKNIQYDDFLKMSEKDLKDIGIRSVKMHIMYAHIIKYEYNRITIII